MAKVILDALSRQPTLSVGRRFELVPRAIFDGVFAKSAMAMWLVLLIVGLFTWPVGHVLIASGGSLVVILTVLAGLSRVGRSGVPEEGDGL